VGLRAAALALLSLLVAPAAPAGAQAVDHYLLALSWSPTFCETADRERERLQCDPSADFTFIVHGLWPTTAGDSPAYCRRGGGPSRRTARAMLDIMPSPGLIAHQWRKHGTCSGLDADDYFATVRRAFEAVTIPAGLATLSEDIDVAPEVLREAFLRTNPGLSEDGIFVRCRSDQLVEVRICMTPDLAFRPCPGIERRRCRSPLLDVPAPE
jgi:ribonuclease T2